jgi:hypothetical protein
MQSGDSRTRSMQREVQAYQSMLREEVQTKELLKDSVA